MACGVVKVRKEILKECVTCSLCHDLLQEATTISLCLHTFCRKCIYDRLSDEEFNSCPVCNVDLGCLPVEKLRPDRNLQDIRSNIFPLESRKTNTPQVTPSISLPAKRKERSLSSSLDGTPKVPIQTGLTVQSTKASGSRGFPFAIEEPFNQEDLFTRQHNSMPLCPHFVGENGQPSMCFNGPTDTETAQGDANFLKDLCDDEFEKSHIQYHWQRIKYYALLAREMGDMFFCQREDARNERDAALGEAKKFKDLYHNSHQALKEERSRRSSAEIQRDLLQSEVRSLKNELALLLKQNATSSDQLRIFQLRISQLENSNLVQNLKDEIEALCGQLSNADSAIHRPSSAQPETYIESLGAKVALSEARSEFEPALQDIQKDVQNKVNAAFEKFRKDGDAMLCLGFRYGWETAMMDPNVRSISHSDGYFELMGIDPDKFTKHATPVTRRGFTDATVEIDKCKTDDDEEE